jgi:two-component system chemotaxis sensor kinase CheA
MDELEAIKVTFFQECDELLADLEGGLCWPSQAGQRRRRDRQRRVPGRALGQGRRGRVRPRRRWSASPTCSRPCSTRSARNEKPSDDATVTDPVAARLGPAGRPCQPRLAARPPPSTWSAVRRPWPPNSRCSPHRPRRRPPAGQAAPTFEMPTPIVIGAEDGMDDDDLGFGFRPIAIEPRRRQARRRFAVNPPTAGWTGGRSVRTRGPLPPTPTRPACCCASWRAWDPIHGALDDRRPAGPRRFLVAEESLPHLDRPTSTPSRARPAIREVFEFVESATASWRSSAPIPVGRQRRRPCWRPPAPSASRPSSPAPIAEEPVPAAPPEAVVIAPAPVSTPASAAPPWRQRPAAPAAKPDQIHVPPPANR